MCCVKIQHHDKPNNSIISLKIMIQWQVFLSVPKHYNPYSGNFTGHASLLTCPTTTVIPIQLTLLSKHRFSPVLPNPRLRCPIGLLLTSTPRPVKPYRYFATFGLLLISWPRNVLKSPGRLCEKLSISCQFRGILNLFNVNEQIYRQLIGLRRHTEPSKVIILNFRSWIIYRFSAQLGDFWLICQARHLDAFCLTKNWATFRLFTVAADKTYCGLGL